MKAIRTLLACIRKADATYDLIHQGDKIIIGLSGGKDSIALTYCLNLYKKFSHTNFTIQPVILDLGFPGFNASELSKFCDSLGLKLIVSDNREVYQILKIQQENQKTKHLPCSICSRMKKAAINKIANELNFNKVAFAHHRDDAIETLVMNATNGGRLATFSPMMHLENANIDFIRPLINCKESDIIKLIKEENLPTFSSFCPADKLTRREDIKKFLNIFYKQFPSSKDSFFEMLSNYKQFDLWGKEIHYQIDNSINLTLKPVVTQKDMIDMLYIRNTVFVLQQNVPSTYEITPEEEYNTTNFLICLNKKPIGCIRYREFENKEFVIGRFAILKEYRKFGYGRKAITFLIQKIKEENTPCIISLHAMYYLKKFYESVGFKPIGKPFLEVNLKHIKMNQKA